jgi:hypothetical protein
VDPLKWLELATKYLTEYVEQFIDVLTQPVFRRDDWGRSALGPQKFDSAFWVFVVVSICLGFLVQAPIFNDVRPDLSQKIAIMLATWFAYAVYAHLVCVALVQGRGPFVSSAVVALKTIAVAYIVSSTCTLLISMASRASGHASSTYAVALTYLGVQAVIIGLFGSAALARAHLLGVLKRLVLVVALPLPVIFFNGAILLGGVGGVGVK